MKKSKAGQELYSLAEALTGTAFTLIFAVALFALLVTGVFTDKGIWYLIGAAVLLVLYSVMWIIRKAGKNAAEQRMAEMTHQEKLHLQELEQRKAVEISVHKAEKPKSSPAPSPKGADAWRAEVHRQAEPRMNKIQLRFVQTSAKYYAGENARWVMEYTSNREYSFMEIVKVFQNIPSTSIDVREDADVGLKTVDDVYDMDYFMKEYKKIACSDIAKIKINTEYQQKRITITMYQHSTTIELVTPKKIWGQQIMEFIANGGGNR